MVRVAFLLQQRQVVVEVEAVADEDALVVELCRKLGDGA